jgi:hypothetical protein
MSSKAPLDHFIFRIPYDTRTLSSSRGRKNQFLLTPTLREDLVPRKYYTAGARKRSDARVYFSAWRRCIPEYIYTEMSATVFHKRGTDIVEI